MAKRNKSNLVQTDSFNCGAEDCIFWGKRCVHPNPNIYWGLGGMCRSYKKKNVEAKEE